MLLLIGGIIIAILLYRYYLRKINREALALTPIEKRFPILIKLLNEEILEGTGNIVGSWSTPERKELFSDKYRNYLILIEYRLGTLTLTLRYLYLHQEMVYSLSYPEMENPSFMKQEMVAGDFIMKSAAQTLEHQGKVMFRLIK